MPTIRESDELRRSLEASAIYSLEDVAEDVEDMKRRLLIAVERGDMKVAVPPKSNVATWVSLANREIVEDSVGFMVVNGNGRNTDNDDRDIVRHSEISPVEDRGKAKRVLGLLPLDTNR